MNPSPIYLDHNATTPLLPEVLDAMLPYLREHFGNPSSEHPFGKQARNAVEAARAQVADLLGCTPWEIIFTSGGTEANNLAIRGIAAARPERRGIVTTGVEHPATSKPCDALEQQGYRVHRIGVDAEGRVRLEELSEALTDDVAIVSILHANNETGVIQPLAKITRMAKALGIAVHTDAAQSVGKIPVDVRMLGVDLLSVAGHKFYAPKGVGALYVRRGTVIEPLVRGANHERGLRPGTENVASIVALGTACAVAKRDMGEVTRRVRGLRDGLFAKLKERVPGLALNGHAEDRLPHTLNVRFPGVLGSALLATAPEIAASTGAACHEGHETASATIRAMGIAPADALGSIRLSLGRSTTAEEIERAADGLARGWARLKG